MSYKARAKSDGVEVEGGSLQCTAHGCPLHWTVSIGNLCSYHAWEDPKHWPSITERLRMGGPWERLRGAETHTVADMKTRLRGRLSSPDVKRLAA